MRGLLRRLSAGLLGLQFVWGSGCLQAQPTWVPEPGDLVSDLSRPAQLQARGQRPEEPLTPPPPPLPLPTPPALPMPTTPTFSPPIQQSPVQPPPTLPFPMPAAQKPAATLAAPLAPPPNPALFQQPQATFVPPAAPKGAAEPIAPPPPAHIGMPAPPKLPPTMPGGDIQLSSLRSDRNRSVAVCAWVNSKPIFVKEISQGIPEGLRADEAERLYKEILEEVIDREVGYQEAIRKLQQVNPKALEKLREFVNQEIEKSVANIRKNPRVTEQDIERFLPDLRRKMEREIISSEFLRSRVTGVNNIHNDDVKEYYDTHKNEFQKPANIEWQDIFLVAGTPNRPTVAHCRQFAQNLLKQLGPNDDLVKLISYDDGAAKINQARGIGNQVGKIQPAEVEPHLLKLKDGQIGPIVELATGVHIIRLVKHDQGSTIPFDEKTQTSIRNILRRQILEREMRRVAKELRARAIVQIEP